MKNVNEIRIAVLDDAVDAGQLQQNGCNIMVETNFHYDKNVPSHGMRVIATIEKYSNCPKQYHFYSIYDEIDTCSQTVLQTLKILAEKDIDIIVMSFTISNESMDEAITEICNELKEKGTIIVASADNRDDNNFPADLDSVIGVGRTFCSKDDVIVNNNERIQVLANVLPEFVKIGEKAWLFSGTSKANAIVAANLVNIISEKKLKFSQLLEVLYEKTMLSKKIHDIDSGIFNIDRHIELVKYMYNKGYIISFNDEREELLFDKMANGLDELGEVVSHAVKYLNMDAEIYDMEYNDFISSFKIINYAERRNI